MFSVCQQGYFCSDSRLAGILWQSNCWQHIFENETTSHISHFWRFSNHCISTFNLQNQVILGTVIVSHTSVHGAQSCVCLCIIAKLPHNQKWCELHPITYSWQGPKASFPYFICKPPMFIIKIVRNTHYCSMCISKCGKWSLCSYQITSI